MIAAKSNNKDTCVQGDQSNRCEECQGNIIFHDYIFVCCQCGLVQEEMIFDQTQHRQTEGGHIRSGFNNWGFPFLPGVKIGDVNRIHGLPSHVCINSLDSFESLSIHYLAIIKSLVDRLHIPRGFWDHPGILFYQWYKKFYGQYVPGELIFVAFEKVCHSNHCHIPPKKELIQTIKEYRVKVTKDRIRALEIQLEIPGEQPISQLDRYLSQFLTEFKDPELYQLCQLHKARVAKISGRSPRVQAAALIYYCVQQTEGLRLSQNELAKYFNISPESIRNLLRTNW